MSDQQAVTKIRIYEDGDVQAEVVSAGSRDCNNVAEIFTAFGNSRNQSTKDDGDCKDVYNNAQDS